MQVAACAISVVGMVALKALPPTTWCMCGVGRRPGSTRGSSLSIVIWEQPKRRWLSPLRNWAAPVVTDAAVTTKEKSIVAEFQGLVISLEKGQGDGE